MLLGWRSCSGNNLPRIKICCKEPLCTTVYPKKYAHGFRFAVLCCGYTLTDFPISIRLTSLALWQSNDCPSASKAILMNMDKCFMWIHYERLHNHNKAKHNKTVCMFLGIYCYWDELNQHRVYGLVITPTLTMGCPNSSMPHHRRFSHIHSNSNSNSKWFIEAHTYIQQSYMTIQDNYKH